MDFLGYELWQVALTGLLFGVLVKLYFRSRDRMPPHVPGIPFLGNIHQVHPLSMSRDLTKLSDTYGDIFTVSIFGQKIVAVNSTELLQETYSHRGDDFIVRPVASNSIRKALYNAQGIFFRPWSVTMQRVRRITNHAIMMIGDQKKHLETLLQQEAETLAEILDEYDGEPVDPQEDIEASMANVIFILALGKKFDRTDPDKVKFTRCMNLMTLIVTPGFGLELDLLPFLWYFPLTSSKVIKEFIELRDEFINKTYQQMKESFQEDSLRCMTDHMIKYMYENPDGDVNDVVIKAVLLDMLAAGVVTSSVVLAAAVVILITHQDIQKKIHQELDSVVGHSQLAGMEHRSDLHYLQAFILEVLRYTSVVSPPRAACRDTSLQGYFIPEGTIMMFNLFSAHHDSRIWPDPYTMDPTRFLDNKGHLVPADHPNRKRLLAFGGGKRSCIGKVFGKNRIYQFLGVMLQRFRFLPAEGGPDPIHDPRDFVPTIVLKPPPFKTKIIRRNLNK